MRKYHRPTVLEMVRVLEMANMRDMARVLDMANMRDMARALDMAATLLSSIVHYETYRAVLLVLQPLHGLLGTTIQS